MAAFAGELSSFVLCPDPLIFQNSENNKNNNNILLVGEWVLWAEPSATHVQSFC